MMKEKSAAARRMEETWAAFVASLDEATTAWNKYEDADDEDPDADNLNIACNACCVALEQYRAALLESRSEEVPQATYDSFIKKFEVLMQQVSE